jgi:hypothetical protein
MKIMSTVFRLIAGSVLALLSAPVWAGAYMPGIASCSVTRVGTDLWQAKFTYTVTYYSATDDTADNGFVLYLLQANAQGKPVAYSGPYANAGWTNLNLGTNPLASATVNNSNINFRGLNSSAVIKGNVNVSVNFTTAGNNAYPALIINYRHLYVGGGGTVSGYYWVTANGCSLGGGAPTLPPLEEINPPEPEFKLSTAKWVLNTTDVGDLPDVTAAGTGYLTTIQNINNNNLCVNYVLAGVKKYTYALNVSNTPSTQGTRSLFMMQGPDSSQLFYNLKLRSSVGTANDYQFPAPGTSHYINLQQGNDIGNGRSQMCWTPEINLFKNATTKAGMHTDTLNFIITPNA